MIIALNETNDLSQRIDLIKNYEMRYLMLDVHGNMAKSYMSTMKLGKTTFNNYINRIIARINKLAMLNENAQKLLLKYSFDYDLDMIYIPDDYVGNWMISFSHATLIVI